MATKKLPIKKPTLIQCGEHYFPLSEIQGIRHAKGNLYILKIKGDESPVYPIWLKTHQVKEILTHFNVIYSEKEINDTELFDDYTED